MDMSNTISWVAFALSVVSFAASLAVTIVLQLVNWGADRHKRAAEQSAKYSRDQAHSILTRLYRELRRPAPAGDFTIAAVSPAGTIAAARQGMLGVYDEHELVTADDFAEAERWQRTETSAGGLLTEAQREALPATPTKQELNKFNKEHLALYLRFKAALTAPYDEANAPMLALIDDIKLLNGWWDETVYMLKTRQLPDNFMDPRNVWLQRSISYVQVAELFAIANWYAVMQYGHQGSMDGAPYLRSKADIGTKGLPNIRCDRYDYLDMEFVRRKGRVPKANFVLAMYEERQRRRDVKLAIG